MYIFDVSWWYTHASNLQYGSNDASFTVTPPGTWLLAADVPLRRRAYLHAYIYVYIYTYAVYICSVHMHTVYYFLICSLFTLLVSVTTDLAAEARASC